MLLYMSRKFPTPGLWSCARLTSACCRCRGGIGKLNDFLQQSGIQMNTAGGLLKISPDGGLLQSSTVADQALCSWNATALLLHVNLLAVS